MTNTQSVDLAMKLRLASTIKHSVGVIDDFMGPWSAGQISDLDFCGALGAAVGSMLGIVHQFATAIDEKHATAWVDDVQSFLDETHDLKRPPQ